MLARELREPRVDLLPDLVRHHRLERRRRAPRARDRARARGRRRRSRTAAPSARAAARTPDQEARDLLDRLLRRRQADAHRRLRGQRGEPLERQREMAAALVAGERVDLVDDHRARRREHPAARLRAEQHVERLGRRHDDVRRALAHARALRLRRVAGAHERADVDVGQPDAPRARARMPASGAARLLLDVVGQRLQRRDVDDERLVGQRRLDPLRNELVDRGEKRGERLARAGRRGDEDVLPALDQRPRPRLRRRRRREVPVEPLCDGGMEPCGIAHRSISPLKRWEMGTRCAQASERRSGHFRTPRLALHQWACGRPTDVFISLSPSCNLSPMG